MRRFLIILSAFFILFLTTLPAFAASAGNVGENYPTIPMYLELRYPDKAVFDNLTDRVYAENTVNHEDIIVSGRTLRTDLITKSQNDTGFLVRKGLISDYELAPIGFDISCPTFYLTLNNARTAFVQTVPYFKIPSSVYVEGVLTYDVFFGGSEAAFTVERSIVSPFDSDNNFFLFTFNEINEKAPEVWSSVRIDNLIFTTTTLNFPEDTAADYSVLAGAWVIDSVFSFLQGSNESYVTYSIPFVSNGYNFTGITFGDTVELIYLDATGLSNTMEVWNLTNGWINEEYRTIYFSDSYTWDDIVKIDGEEYTFAGSEFKSWITNNATKLTNQNGYDGSYIFQWRYQVQSMDLINSYLNAYLTEYQGTGDTDAAYLEGFRDGQTEGFDRGFSEGYDEGYGSASGGGFELGTFLVTVVGGFFDFQIFPGFSIGGIFAIFLGVLLLVAFLKHFAGG